MESKNFSSPAHPVPPINQYGLTKLEIFTMSAMQGFCTQSTFSVDSAKLAQKAVEVAKLTLSALEKPEGGASEQAK